ncbi:hypothetical protein ACFWBN_35115 [Streptomyces sp. NPDC059989]|uniref:hypothetical protein n=1 Tax=Streptomyces sp. NPDC059989 TaxID=3347026 RepID=UPI00369929ED
MVAGRQIRFTAVLVAVVFALTGFSSHGGSSSSGSSGSSSGGKSKSKSSSGGGCSSSKTKKKSHSGGNGSTASASASPTGDPATAVVVTCTGPQQTTTVKFTSRLDRRADFKVNLYRENAAGTVVESSVVRVTLAARETRTVDVALEDPSHAAEVKNCRVAAPETDAGGSTVPDGASTSKSTPKPSSTPKSTPKPTKSKR